MGLPVARMGLEHEFFLVDRRGEPRNLADLFLRECREAARAEGLDLHCFKAESVMGMVEITTPPSHSVEEITSALSGYSRAGAGYRFRTRSCLVSVGDVSPLPISPVLREDPGYMVKASILGQDRFVARRQVRRGAPASGVARRHRLARREGGARRPCSRPTGASGVLQPRHRPRPGARGALPCLPLLPGKDRRVCRQDGPLQGHPRLRRSLHGHARGGRSKRLREPRGRSGRSAEGALQAWFAAMDRAGVKRRLFAQAGGNLHRASWNPVRLSLPRHRRVQDDGRQLSRDGAGCLCPHPRRRGEGQARTPGGEAGQGCARPRARRDLLHVPSFSYLNGELLCAAVTRGVQDPRVEAYVDSFVRFASPYLEVSELVGPLGTSGNYKNTESKTPRIFPRHQPRLHQPVGRDGGGIARRGAS